MDWDSVTNESVKKFSLEGESIMAKVVSVYDGDTVTIATFHLNPSKPAVAFKCRLLGIDTPELRTTDDKEKEAGYAARDALREMILNKVVRVHCGPFDKYGRLLVTIEDEEGENINNLMIDEGHAKEYDGVGARVPYSEW